MMAHLLREESVLSSNMLKGFPKKRIERFLHPLALLTKRSHDEQTDVDKPETVVVFVSFMKEAQVLHLLTGSLQGVQRLVQNHRH